MRPIQKRKKDSGIGNLTQPLQHLYIPVANEQSSPMFRVMTEDRVGMGSAAPSNVTMPYKYNVRVSQIDCTAPVNEFNRAVRGEEEREIPLKALKRPLTN